MPIELKNVSFAYSASDGNDIPALRDVCLKINEGDFVGIMGHTGCGKTTLIQLMAGLMTPASGKILLDGHDINEKNYARSKLRESISLVFQFPEYQLFETTVEKDVAFGLKHLNISRDEANDRVKWALETMGFSFDSVRTRSPLSLSGGEKRRVAIAGALVTKPRFLFFDEPIAGLDPANRHSFLEIVTRLNKEGTAIVMVSHNEDAICEYAKRLLVFNKGILAIDDNVKHVFSNPKMLEGLHLNISTARTIGDMLSMRGIPIPNTATSYHELLCAIKTAFAGGFKS